MAIHKGKPLRKTILRGNRSIFIETHDTCVISENFYSTNGEELLVIKDVNLCKLKLDSTTTEKITIKTLTNLIIIPDIGKIDEDWDEISLKRGSCIEFQFVHGTWYILSSDGMKLE
jgi:hypothetical protein